MSVLKNIAFVFVLALLGVAIGTGLFYLQKSFVPTTTAQTETSPTPTVKAAVAATTYTNSTLGLSMLLPVKTIVRSEQMASTTRTNITWQLTLESQKSDLEVSTTDTTVYIVQNQDNLLSQLTQAKKVLTTLTANLVKDSLYTDSAFTTSTRSHTRYAPSSTADDTDDAYLLPVDTRTTALVYRHQVTGGEAVNDTDLLALVNSLKPLTAGTTVATPTPSPSSSSLLLNSPSTE